MACKSGSRCEKWKRLLRSACKNGTVNLTRKERFPLKEAEKVKGGYQSDAGKVIKVLVEPGQEVKSGDGF